MLIRKKTPAAKSSGRGSSTRTRQQVAALLVALSITTGGGCLPQIIRSTAQPYQTLVFLQTLKWRATMEARQMWGNRLEASYANHACRNDVKDGFITAYVETALGSDGCPPPVPRTSAFYRTIGQRTPAPIPWYEGYDLGHALAVANGVDRWRLLPIDPDLEAEASRHVCSQEVVGPHEGHLIEDQVIEGQVIEGHVIEVPVIEDDVIEDHVIEGPVVEAPVINAPDTGDGEIMESLDGDAEVLADPDRPSYAEPIPPGLEPRRLPKDAATPAPNLLEL